MSFGATTADGSHRFFARSRFSATELPRAFVERHRLLERLDAGPQFAFVIAAPGSGKSAMLSAWTKHRQHPTAWLTCDPADDDALGFWTALATALQRIAGGVGGDAMRRLREDGQETVSMAASLADDCAVAPGLAIVIDDFHNARCSPDVFAAFMRALPADVRLVVATRHDPTFDVTRLRIQGRLDEIRGKDLNLSLDEAELLFKQLELEVSPADLERILAVTEGWAAGLNLSAIALRSGGNDIRGLVDAFESSERALSDFLLNEVVDVQPPVIADFLMKTSVFDAFDGDLCDRVTGRSDSARLIEDLRRHNQFVIALEHAGSYRYHHLLSRCLEARLRAGSEEQFRQAHVAAAEALVRRDDRLTAIRHYLAAGDVESAMELVRGIDARAQDRERRKIALDAVRRWLNEHGERSLLKEPARVIEGAFFLAALDAHDEATAWLDLAEHRDPPLGRIDAAFALVARGLNALVAGDPAAALASLGSALEQAGEDGSTHRWISNGPAISCHAHLVLGDASGARSCLDDARVAGIAGIGVNAAREAGSRAMAAVLDGDLDDACHDTIVALETARTVGLVGREHMLVIPHLARAAIARERGDLDEAGRIATGARDHALAGGRTTEIFLAQLEMAMLAMARGEHDLALRACARARKAHPHPAPEIMERVARVEARIEIGRSPRRARARIEALGPGLERSFLAARCALAERDPVAAARALASAPREPASRRERVEHGLLSARILAATDRRAAQQVVANAIDLAAPPELAQMVVDEGPEISLLVEALPRDVHPEFVERVLGAVRGRGARSTLAPSGRSIAGAEPLSDRERDVLRLLASRLKNREIADELFISVNTLKTHVKAVYRKLGVSQRSDAVGEARRLGVL